MKDPKKPDILVVFPSPLGWMALIGGGNVLKQLTFGHRSAAAAIQVLDPLLRKNARRGTWNAPLLRRLRAYALGAPVDFRDVPIDPGPLSEFQQKVLDRCREIVYGQTLSYGRLAVAAGFPGAARAVGNCMARNRIPLVIPCHRVLPASGGLGRYSAPGGSATKQRLLAMEAGQSR